MADETLGMSADELVEKLRSENADDRQAALDELYPKAGGTLLFHIGHLTAQTSWTKEVDAGRMFVALLQMAQQLGKNLGMELNWVRQQQPNPDGIVIPGGHHG